MGIERMIQKLRTSAKLSQEQFASLFGVSRQSVQKWESGASVPELSKIIEISKYFDISLDALVLNRDNRTLEALNYNKEIKPRYSSMHDWEFYTSDILTEYQQSVEEGLDIEAYKDLFEAASRLPKNEIKKKIGDVLFEVVINAKTKEDYKYIEPSDLDGIKKLRKEYCLKGNVDRNALENKIYGAWMGRVCGCMLGKTVECIRTNELVPFLKETDNYPMHRYIYKSDINEAVLNKYSFPFAAQTHWQNRCIYSSVYNSS